MIGVEEAGAVRLERHERVLNRAREEGEEPQRRGPHVGGGVAVYEVSQELLQFEAEPSGLYRCGQAPAQRLE